MFRPSENMRDADSQHTADQSKDTDAIIQEQLTTLAELTGDARAELETLQQEVSELSIRLQNSQARIGTLAALLVAHEQLLRAIRASIAIQPTETISQTSTQSQPTVESPAPPNSSAEPVAPSSNTSIPPTPQQHSARPVASSAQPARPVTPTAETTRPAATAPPVPSQPVENKPMPASTPPSNPTPSAATAPPVPSVPTARSDNHGPVGATPAPGRPAERPSSSARPENSETGKIVRRGSRVEIVFNDDTDEEIETYTIVPTDEANPARNLIGENSPLGSALLGAHPGDVRRFRVGGTGPERAVRICAIS